MAESCSHSVVTRRRVRCAVSLPAPSQNASNLTAGSLDLCAQTFHLYLSHSWKHEVDQCGTIKARLSAMGLRARIFNPLEDPDDPKLRRQRVQESNLILAFVTHDYILDRRCRKDILHALEYQKPILVLYETAEGREQNCLDNLMADTLAGKYEPARRRSSTSDVRLLGRTRSKTRDLGKQRGRSIQMDDPDSVPRFRSRMSIGNPRALADDTLSRKATLGGRTSISRLSISRLSISLGGGRPKMIGNGRAQIGELEADPPGFEAAIELIVEALNLPEGRFSARDRLTTAVKLIVQGKDQGEALEALHSKSLPEQLEYAIACHSAHLLSFNRQLMIAHLLLRRYVNELMDTRKIRHAVFKLRQSIHQRWKEQWTPPEAGTEVRAKASSSSSGEGGGNGSTDDADDEKPTSAGSEQRWHEKWSSKHSFGHLDVLPWHREAHLKRAVLAGIMQRVYEVESRNLKGTGGAETYSHVGLWSLESGSMGFAAGSCWKTKRQPSTDTPWSETTVYISGCYDNATAEQLCRAFCVKGGTCFNGHTFEHTIEVEILPKLRDDHRRDEQLQRTLAALVHEKVEDRAPGSPMRSAICRGSKRLSKWLQRQGTASLSPRVKKPGEPDGHESVGDASLLHAVGETSPPHALGGASLLRAGRMETAKSPGRASVLVKLPLIVLLTPETFESKALLEDLSNLIESIAFLLRRQHDGNASLTDLKGLVIPLFSCQGGYSFDQGEKSFKADIKQRLKSLETLPSSSFCKWVEEPWLQPTAARDALLKALKARNNILRNEPALKEAIVMNAQEVKNREALTQTTL